MRGSHRDRYPRLGSTKPEHRGGWTFYIDESGRILHIDKNVDVATAAQEMPRNFETLGFPTAE